MSRKTISIITFHYTPENSGAGQRLEAMAKTLSASFKVQVFALSSRIHSRGDYFVKVDENLTIHYVSAYLPSNTFSFFKSLIGWWYSLKLIRRANEVNADLALIALPVIYLFAFISALCNAKKKMIDLNSHNTVMEAPGLFGKKIRKNFLKRLHHLLNKFDLVTVSNEDEQRWLEKDVKIPLPRIQIVHDGIGIEKFKTLSACKYLNGNVKFSISYIGSVNHRIQFETIIDAVRGMDDVTLNIIGDGDDLKRLKQYVDQNNIYNVNLPGWLPWIKARPYYQTSDLLFASRKKEIDTLIPSKLYEYLATGLPILYQGGGSASQFLRRFNNTFVTSGNDVRAFEKLIWRIKRLAPRRSPENVQNIKNNFIREKLCIRFAESAARLLNEPKHSGVYVEDILQSAEH